MSTPADAPPPRPPRLDGVDFLRGAVMILMVLDHTRDFFTDQSVDPGDLSRATPALFLTRWVTHFCAPVFAFLAGTGAYLAGRRGKTRGELAAFLFTRGVWLIVLELTVVKLGILFNPAPSLYFALVFWSIGWSLIVLAGLVCLPTPVVGALGVLMILTHNLADGLRPEQFGVLAPLWTILHQQGFVGTPPGPRLLVLYPLIPWVGVVASGYAFGPLLQLPAGRRRGVLLALGLSLTVAFVVLRGLNVYGDPGPWSRQGSVEYTIFSFLNCQKYPPSLSFLLMTLGPPIAGLAVFDRVPGVLSRPVVTLGRVPLLFYILQWYVIHGLALVVALALGRTTGWLFSHDLPPSPPSGAAFPLSTTYLVWVVVVVILFPPCLAFARLKQVSRNPWLSYL